jgi:hypothetical protein
MKLFLSCENDDISKMAKAERILLDAGYDVYIFTKENTSPEMHNNELKRRLGYILSCDGIAELDPFSVQEDCAKERFLAQMVGMEIKPIKVWVKEANCRTVESDIGEIENMNTITICHDAVVPHHHIDSETRALLSKDQIKTESTKIPFIEDVLGLENKGIKVNELV